MFPAKIQAEKKMPENEKLLKFPCLFPIKIVGVTRPGFRDEVGECVRSICPAFDPKTVAVRPSSQGKYEACSVTVTAGSQEQLDELYRALNKITGVKFIL